MKKLIILFLLISLPFAGFSQTYLDPDAPVDERVEDLLSRMTLEEKIGQMTQAEKGGVESSGLNDIEDYYLGSVLSGGGSVPYPNTPESWVDLYNSMQNRALSTRLGIPILYGIDAVHGHNNLKDAVIFPHNIGLGCTRNPELVKECARITALEVRATGLNWTFSPCLSVPQNEFWGRTYEGFGESTSLVDSMAAPAVLGYQTDSIGNDGAVLACAKHFVGDGGTENGIDQGNTAISEEKLRNIHLPPYISAVNAGVGTMMASFSSWNGNKCHGSKFLLTDLLKDELGFEGFIVSDWLGIDQLNGDLKLAVEQAINAGIDMAMQPYNYVDYITNLKELVNEGRVAEERIDDAVRRILRIKFQMGLFENPLASKDMIDTVGCDSHRETARQAVRESLVLLKNDGFLPLSANDGSILVAGSKATDIGAQCGGWTITWQGQLGNITEGVSIYEGVKNVVGSGNIEYTANPEQIPVASRAVVVVGESPYAEGNGDIFQNSSNSFHLSDEDKAMVQAVKDMGIPMVVVLLSGRPLDIREELNMSDAFFAAWLPGTEGGSGIADVLFGDYEPTGKLSHTWPESADDVPINPLVESTDNEALFPYGYGLDYESTANGLNNQDKDGKMKVYPNPAEEYVNLRWSRNKSGRIIITDMAGRLVKTIPVRNKSRIRLSLAEFEAGIYVLVHRNSKGERSQTLMSVVK
jgi:beta-glucosidase